MPSWVRWGLILLLVATLVWMLRYSPTEAPTQAAPPKAMQQTDAAPVDIGSPASDSTHRAFEVPEPQPTVPLPVTAPYPGPLRVESGQTIALRSTDLRTGKPVVARLFLPEPVAPGVDTLPVTVRTGDGGSYEPAPAVVDADRHGAIVAIDSERLRTPGRYVVELRTTETSHIPLRRFAIEILRGE